MIHYLDRVTGDKKEEKVYGGAALKFLYGDDFVSKVFGAPLVHLLSKYPFFSALYGFWQKRSFTRKKIKPFIEHFGVDASEFAKQVDAFTSFNDFFVRELKPEARPIASRPAIIPADGRYLFYPNISETDGFVVKGEKFDLCTLLEDATLASQYAEGTMVIARLCPSDYHRYHFPCDCTPGATRYINGWLYSVNPIAIKKDIHIFTQNKRTLCELQTEHFGKVLFLEIGATSVGSIHQTYQSGQPYSKGDEKGFFSFGASSLILLFEPGMITLASDLVAATQQGIEIRCLMGQDLLSCPINSFSNSHSKLTR